MRLNHLFLLTALAAVFWIVGCTDDKSTWDGNTVVSPPDTTGVSSGTDLKFNGVVDYSKLTASNHPRVIYTNDDFAAMKELYAAGTNQYFNTISDCVVNNAYSYVGAADLEYKISSQRLSCAWTAEKRILSCAYAYKMTGDERYLTQVEHDIQTVCNFTDWNAYAHFLDAAGIADGVGLAYDWLFNELSSTTKTLAKRALNDFAFYPVLYNYSEVGNKFLTSTNNWNQVCNAGLVCAALAVYEDYSKDAKTIVENALVSNVDCMVTEYSPDGGYPEGYSYWSYGTSYETTLLTALYTALGSDNGLSNTEGFSKTGQFMVNMEGPSGLVFNFSDCKDNTETCSTLWYFAWRFNDLSNLCFEKDRVSRYSSDACSNLLAIIPFYAYQINVTDISVPTESIYYADGLTPVVLIHDTWTMDGNDKFLGIKGGLGSTSHAHLDSGSFVYDADGVRWAYDYSRQEYAELEAYYSIWGMTDGSQRWNIFRYNNYNHNTVTVNDAYFKVAGKGYFTDIIDSDGRKGATIDLTGPISTSEISSAVRSIYMEGDDLVIEDTYKALSSKAANVRWTLVTKAVPTIEYGAITLKQGNKTRYLTYSSSTNSKIAWSEFSTEPMLEHEAKNPGYYECGYTLTVNAGQTAVVTIRLTPIDPLE